MKRFIFTVSFCSSLLAFLSFWFFAPAEAAENPLLALLNLPAPPPPNPQVTLPEAVFSEKFYSKSNPPPDDAPIADLIEYWRALSDSYVELGYNPKPSSRVLERLLAEVERDPSKVNQFLNAFRGSEKAADLVKRIYDRMPSGNETERDVRTTLRRWLTYNSPYFSSDLARGAARVADVNEYVNHQEELLALGRVDWERARSIVDRLYAGNQKVSRVLAQWALYRHALDENSLGDIERYREELKAVVEDKTASGGMRDLAFDALVKEKEWDGRDEWYYSLLSDETLDDLQVGGRTYTGLTTIMYYSPEERYVDKMIELVKSDNKAVRTAAAKNLLHRLSSRNPEVIRALLPWLEDPKWIKSENSARNQIVSALQNVKVPESVPGLIAILDEKITVSSSVSNTNANAWRSPADAVAHAANVAAAAANTVSNTYAMRTEDFYPLRYSAIAALGNQEDARAIPVLRRLLNEISQPYEKNGLIGALLKCGAFSVAEQVNAVEHVARESAAVEETMIDGPTANVPIIGRSFPNLITSFTDTQQILGAHVINSPFPSDELARAMIDRITSLDRTDPQTAKTLRMIILNWHAPAVNALLLRDLKKGQAEPQTIVRLLGARRYLREAQLADVSDVRTGGPIAVGISACLLEDPNDLLAILNSPSDETKTAMLACARLIRAPLPVTKVAANLQSKDKLLALAAERYLETEDSPEARRIVLSLHPNEAKILGATTMFSVEPGTSSVTGPPGLLSIFVSVSPYHALPQTYNYTGDYESESRVEREKRVQAELKRDTDLVGIYSLDDNYIKIYKDRAVLSWDEDTARYRERVLTSEEFDSFKGLLAHYKADEQPPFLSCVRTPCETKELLMVGRNGGRRVFVKAASLPPLFAEIDRTFEQLRQTPAAIKYWAARDIPGLEVLFADERMDAMAVWKSGADLRLLTADKVRRVEIDSEIEQFNDSLPDDVEEAEPEDEYGTSAAEQAVEKEKTRREYENYGWFDFSNGKLGAAISQPPNFEYIPLKDSFAVPAAASAWKARAGLVEIRADDKGLYKIVSGRLTKIKSGYYSDPVLTANGRWIVTTKFDNDAGPKVVRVNVLTNKEMVVDQALDVYVTRPVVFVPSINRVILGPDEEYYGSGPDGEPGEDGTSGYALLDPETGRVSVARGEIRPLIQQTFRSLQSATAAFQYWAAIPKENETVIGLYDPRSFNFKPLLKLPKISFDSMDLWVDDAGARAYFVYEGHLLAVPLKVR